MKNRFLAGCAIVALMIAGVLCAGVRAQTTDEGNGPSEHPSAPMEGGTPQATQNPQAGPPLQPGQQPGQPGEAEPGGPELARCGKSLRACSCLPLERDDPPLSLRRSLFKETRWRKKMV